MIKNYYYYIMDKFATYNLKRNGRINLQGNIFIHGSPIIKIFKDAELTLGNNVTLNSRNYRYQAASMYSPMKIIADKNAKIEIGDNSRINGTCIHAISNISIGENCLIASNTNIFDSNRHDISFENLPNRLNISKKPKDILIEDYVWIGLNSIILPGVKIAYGSVVGAGSIVTKDVPPMSIVAGNPAKIIRKYESDIESIS
jgi:acetyltransferase-like isoleucine patch superfamily enzyme